MSTKSIMGGPIATHNTNGFHKTNLEDINMNTDSIIANDQKNKFNTTQNQYNMQPDIDLLNYKANDGGLATAWIENYGIDWFYDLTDGHWYHWNGAHWEPSYETHIYNQVQMLVNTFNTIAANQCGEALSRGNDNEAKMWKAYIKATQVTSHKINSIVTLIRHSLSLDTDKNQPNMLNFPNGTLDLDTLIFRTHNRDDYFKYVLKYEYDPTATCSRWNQFVNEVFVHEDDQYKTNPELRDFVQEMMGYSLTTNTKHEVMMWCRGNSQDGDNGGNGKSVFIRVLEGIFGTFAQSIDFQAKDEYWLADIQGKRIIYQTEVDPNKDLPMAYIKQIVSGETIPGRQIQKQRVYFKSISKIWLTANQLPRMKNSDNSIWRRMLIIPFNRKFANHERDEYLFNTLNQELPGILNWAIDGLKRLNQRGKVITPPVVLEAVELYKTDSNNVRQWFKECAQISGDLDIWTGSTPLHQNYQKWCQLNGYGAKNATNFGTELIKIKGVQKKTSNGIKYNIMLI